MKIILILTILILGLFLLGCTTNTQNNNSIIGSWNLNYQGQIINQMTFDEQGNYFQSPTIGADYLTIGKYKIENEKLILNDQPTQTYEITYTDSKINLTIEDVTMTLIKLNNRIENHKLDDEKYSNNPIIGTWVGPQGEITLNKNGTGSVKMTNGQSGPINYKINKNILSINAGSPMTQEYYINFLNEDSFTLEYTPTCPNCDIEIYIRKS
jgi:hypothetical protein